MNEETVHHLLVTLCSALSQGDRKCLGDLLHLVGEPRVALDPAASLSIEAAYPHGVRLQTPATTLILHLPAGPLLTAPPVDQPAERHRVLFRHRADQHTSADCIPTQPWHVVGSWLHLQVANNQIQNAKARVAAETLHQRLDDDGLLFRDLRPHFAATVVGLRRLVKLLEESWRDAIVHDWSWDFAGVRDAAGRRLGVRLDDATLLRLESPDGKLLGSLPMDEIFLTESFCIQIALMRDFVSRTMQ